MGTGMYDILLVTADPIEKAFLSDALVNLTNGSTYRLTHARRLDEALAQIDLQSFHFMVVDLELPDSKGLSTFVKVQGFTPSIPTIVMVNSEDRHLALETSSKGAHDYLVKGEWNGELLERVIRHSLERQRLAAEFHDTRDELRRSEQKFRAFFEATTDLMYIKDENLELTDVNPAMASLFKMKPSELIGATAEKLHGKKAARQIEQWDRRALGGESVEEEHTRMVNGVPMTFLDLRVPLRNARNQITGVCCISRNITERRSGSVCTVVDEPRYPSEAMRSLMAQAARIAPTEGTVLLLGESGTGKDYLARWIHDHSDRCHSPYFSLNCAALSRELAESELFGHESGAFTGARGRKRGMLELAEGGTLLLNEIGELPLSLQSKLLTFLDTRSFLRVGGEKAITVDARIMAASHRDLEAEVANRRFLEPLFHRLNVFSLRLPPLRERIEDLPILVESLMQQLAKKMQLAKIPGLDQSLLNGLAAHNWPGNIREVKNALERALMLWDGGRFDMKLATNGAVDRDRWSLDFPFPSGWTLKEVLNEVTKQMCMQALQRSGGNKQESARMLGTSRDALYSYIRRFGIDVDLLT
jgi:PAS domain S-box-containing protein